MFLKTADCEYIGSITQKQASSLFEEIMSNNSLAIARTSVLPEDHPMKQNFNTLRRIAEKKDTLLAFATRAISAHETYGPNRNADSFEREQLKKSYKTFVLKPHLIDHKMEIPYVRGIIADARWNDPKDYVETLIFVDKENFPKYAESIEKGIINGFSMGVQVEEAECSICHNIARNADQFCFLPDTQVIMADGTAKAIQDIKEGDLVISHTGQARRVTKTFVRDVSEEIVGIDIRGIQNVIWCTKNHPFLKVSWDKIDWVPSGFLREGDLLVMPLTKYTPHATVSPEFAEYRTSSTLHIPVSSIENQNYTGRVYNIEVEEDHSYLVEGLAVHNCDHIPKLKGLVIGGVKCFEFNRGLTFIEQSSVVSPADPHSHTLYILANTKVKQHPEIERLKKVAELLNSYTEQDKQIYASEYLFIESFADQLANRIAKEMGIQL